MQKAAVLITMAGVMLFVYRPLTKSELDTVRMKLQIKIEAVDEKIDKLSQQVQTLIEKMDRLDRRFVALEKSLAVGQGQNPTEATEKVIPPKVEELIEKRVRPSEDVQ